MDITQQEQKATPLQQQLDAVSAQAVSQLPEEILKQMRLPVEELIASGAAEQALKVGMQAPDFTLPDALGHAVTLSQLLQEGPALVVFYRGAWCPYCNLQLHSYQQLLPQLQAEGARLVAISPQTPDHSLSQIEKQELTFAVLSDTGNQVARTFGLVYTLPEEVRALHAQLGANLPEYNGDQSWELPISGTFLIDQSGTVRQAFVDPDFTHRPDLSLIIAALKALHS